MAQQIELRVDPLVLGGASAKGTHYSGWLDQQMTPRLVELLAEPKVDIQVALDFTMDRPGTARATGTIGGTVSLCCQRCLASFDQPIHLDFEARFVPHDQPQSDDDVDVELDEDGMLALRDLIEDELILAVPLIPKHPLGECDSVVLDKYMVEEVDEQKAPTQRPFAEGLAGLTTKTKD